MKRIAIIIPAYNEAARIQRTLYQYGAFFNTCKEIEYSLIVSLNGCTDKTKEISNDIKLNGYPIQIIECKEAGKGLAIKNGFLYAIKENKYDYIGFVDADMATRPEYFYELIDNIQQYDGIIASRYMKKSIITPQRPFLKRWGSKLVYESLIYILFGMRYKDYQCGAKLFKTKTIQAVIHELQVKQWAFDVELLYACKIHRFTIKEHPTVWHDQAGSKLKLSHGIFMLGQLIKLRLQHLRLCSILTKK